MVDQSTTGINGVKHMVLIAGIVMIGLLDIAFTTFVNHEDLVRTPVAELATVPAVDDRSDNVLLPLLNEQAESASPAILSNRRAPWRKVARYDRADQPLPRQYVARAAHSSQIASFPTPMSDCRTVTYPFVGDGYIVQVTDDLGCLSSDRSKQRQNNLFAKLIQHRQKHW